MMALALLLALQTSEAELAAKISVEWTDLASWCASRSLWNEGRAALAEARAMYPENPKLDDVEKKLDGGGEAADAARKAYDKERDKSHQKLAKLYAELALARDPDDDALLVRAFELDPKRTAKLLDGEVAKARAAKELARAHRLLSGMERASPDEKRGRLLREVELALAETEPVERTCRSHPMKYLLVLPKGWNEKRTWPILVTCEGAGSNFIGNCRGFLGQRGDLPFIIVTPFAVSSTNEIVREKYGYADDVYERVDKEGRLTFDVGGIVAILDEVRAEFKGEEKIYITGFSGGGNPTYGMIFNYPQMIAAASPCCANYASWRIADGAGPTQDEKPFPIKAFQGDKDDYLDALNQQWANAEGELKRLNYSKVERVMLPGVGHSGCAKQAIEFFGDVLNGR